MNCAEVQTQLLEYLDRTLDAITTKHVEIHLSSCHPCRTEVDGLSDCIRQIAALPIVDPPLGFAQRVMAHAREIERSPTLWQRFALPWRLNKPIQATALVLIAVFSVYLYRVQGPQSLEPVQFTPSGTDVATAFTTQSENTQTQITTAESAPKRAEVTQPPLQETSAKISSPGAPGAAETPSAPPVAAAKTESENRLEPQLAAPRRAPIQVQEVATGREGSQTIRETFGFREFPFGAARQQPLRSTAPASEERPLFSVNEPIADLEFVVRRRPAQSRQQTEHESADSARHAPETEAGPQTAAASPAAPFFSSMVIETRWYTVAPEHLEHFKKDLSAETIIESESVAARRDRESTARPLAVKITILPANNR